MEAMAAAEAEGVTVEEKCRLLNSQKKDIRQLHGLVGTLLGLVEDFLFFSKIQQVIPVESDFKVGGQGGLIEEIGFAGPFLEIFFSNLFILQMKQIR
jgi:hypothetical protein